MYSPARTIGLVGFRDISVARCMAECCTVDCLTESNESVIEYAVGGLCNLALGKNSKFYVHSVVEYRPVIN